MIRNSRFTYFRVSRYPFRDHSRPEDRANAMPDPRRRDPGCHERIMPVRSDEDEDGGEEPFDPRGGDDV